METPVKAGDQSKALSARSMHGHQWHECHREREGTNDSAGLDATSSTAFQEQQLIRSVAGPVVIRGKVLLAEDDDDLRGVLCHLLEALGLEVIEADSGIDLLDMAIKNHPFDLIVSDVRMPWIDGLQAAIALRHAGYSTPLIVMSAFGTSALRSAVATIHNAKFLDKPFEPTLFASAVCEALGRRNTDRDFPTV